MASVFICRCHHSDSQGVRIPGGLSEWQLVPAINSAIRDKLWLAGHSTYRLKGTLIKKVGAVNAMYSKTCQQYAIEVHCNWSSDTQREGFFVMAHKRSTKGIYLAHAIVDEMAHVLGHGKNKGVNLVDEDEQWIETRHQYKTERQYFICRTKCPAVLVECGFLSNMDEAKWIADIVNRSRLGKAIGLGIAAYLKGVSNETR